MSANKYGFQLVIVAEDENLVEVANGFFSGMGGDRRIHIEPVDGPRRVGHGWSGAVKTVPNYNLERFQNRHLLLLVDFDNDPGLRLSGIRRNLDELGQSAVHDRIYVLGVFKQSEDLEREGASYFNFGTEIARFCRGESSVNHWRGDSLKLNEPELLRLRQTVCCRFADLYSTGSVCASPTFTTPASNTSSPVPTIGTRDLESAGVGENGKLRNS